MKTTKKKSYLYQVQAGNEVLLEMESSKGHPAVKREMIKRLNKLKQDRQDVIDSNIGDWKGRRGRYRSAKKVYNSKNLFKKLFITRPSYLAYVALPYPSESNKYKKPYVITKQETI